MATDRFGYAKELVGLDVGLLMTAQDEGELEELALGHVMVAVTHLASMGHSEAQIVALVKEALASVAPLAEECVAEADAEREADRREKLRKRERPS